MSPGNSLLAIDNDNGRAHDTHMTQTDHMRRAEAYANIVDTLRLAYAHALNGRYTAATSGEDETAEQVAKREKLRDALVSFDFETAETVEWITARRWADA